MSYTPSEVNVDERQEKKLKDAKIIERAKNKNYATD